MATQILAIASKTFTCTAADTRQSEGYSIQTRYAPKVFRLCVLRFCSTSASSCSVATPSWCAFDQRADATFPNPLRTDTATIAVNGFAADGKVLVQRIQQRLEVRPAGAAGRRATISFALQLWRACSDVLRRLA